MNVGGRQRRELVVEDTEITENYHLVPTLLRGNAYHGKKCVGMGSHAGAWEPETHVLYSVTSVAIFFVRLSLSIKP